MESFYELFDMVLFVLSAMEPVNPGVVPKEELGISSPGAARAFFCRMKNRLQPEVVLKTEPDVINDNSKKRRPGERTFSLLAHSHIHTCVCNTRAVSCRILVWCVVKGVKPLISQLCRHNLV